MIVFIQLLNPVGLDGAGQVHGHPPLGDREGGHPW